MVRWEKLQQINPRRQRSCVSLFSKQKSLTHMSPFLAWKTFEWCKKQHRSLFWQKSGTLEAVGLLLPFLAFPTYLANQHILLETDNLSIVYGWEKKYCKNDPETSLLLRALHVIEAYLACKIYVKHIKRCSNTMSKLVDSLSRKTTTSEDDLCLISKSQLHHPQGNLIAWLRQPFLDWTLPNKILSDVKKLMK
jgi:hypothetical protein